MESQADPEPLNYAHTVLEQMPIGVALFDAQDLRLLAANALYHSLLDTYLDPDWRNGRALGHPIVDWLPVAQPNEIEAHLRRVAEVGIPFQSGEYAFPMLKHGMTYWNWTINPVRNSNGLIRQLLLTTIDVTAQVLARQQAEQPQNSLNQINRRVEKERKRLEVIETIARSVRESLDTENIGKAAIDAIVASFDPLSASIHIADPAQLMLCLLHLRADQHIEQETVALLKHVPYTSPLLVARGTRHRDPIIVEDVQVAAMAGILPGDHPSVKYGGHGYICIPLWFKDHFEGTLSALFKETIASDSLEVQTLVGCSTHLAAALAHARLHTAIQNEHSRLHSVLDQLPEGVLLVEISEGVINYANAAAAEILGVPSTSLVNTSLNQYSQAFLEMDMKDRSILPWNFAVIRALCGKALNSQEMIVIKPDGNKVVVLSSTAPLRNEYGMITGAAIVFQDITARKSIEQQKNEFLSIASHELRTPITAIQGFAEILQYKIASGQSLDSSPRTVRAVTSIVEQSERLTQLIGEMFDLVRIENVQLLLNLAPHDLLGTLNHVIETQAVTSTKHHLQLVLDGLQPTDVLMGYFDKNRIEQVVSNLLSNAIKYSPAGGEIELGLDPILNADGRPSEALIWVRDHGIGISVNELPHIFERYHRASNLDRSISGLGIGLYLTKELVERHGGRIWVKSTEGMGTTFFVNLPLDKSSPQIQQRKRSNS